MDHLLALPLVLTFFLVFGLRAAFAVPIDPDANWPFRVAPPPAMKPVMRAVAAAMMLFGVLPVTVVWLLATASLWGVPAGAAAAALHVASGWALVELLALTCTSVPFTRPHVASSNAVRSGWAWFIVALHLFAFRLDDLQLAALASGSGVVTYLGAMFTVAAGARVYASANARGWSPRFDPPIESETQALNLSGAAG